MLKLFSVRESLIDRDVGPAYLSDQTTPIEMDDDGDLWVALGVLLVAVLVRYLDVDSEKYLPENYDEAAVRDGWGLTTEPIQSTQIRCTAAG